MVTLSPVNRNRKVGVNLVVCERCQRRYPGEGGVRLLRVHVSGDSDQICWRLCVYVDQADRER